MENNTIVGIDLGTTNSVVSLLDKNTPVTIQIDNQKLLPSVVSLTNEGFIVGQMAKNLAILEPEKTIKSIKRKMGQNITLTIGDRQMRPEEISSIILGKIRDTAINSLGLTDDKLRTVITVPAYFTEEQREATRHAAELAGLKLERIINEPTAAALAFGLNKRNDEKYAIYDLGGGTFDISIVENNSGVIEVLSTNGDNYLGGDDFDELLADFIWNKFLNANDIKQERTRKINARLIKIAEETKIKLSDVETIAIKENFFLKLNDNVYHLEVTVSRKDFENLIIKKIEKTVNLIESAVDDAKVDLNSLDGIILVGGCSRIPLVAKMIENKLNIVPTLIDLPDEAVSHGATIQGAIINHIEVDTILVDITPHSLGIAVLNDDILALLKDLKERGEEEDRRLIQSIIISKNSTIPVKKTEQYNAVVPFQEAYRLQIYQGEHYHAMDNKFIGETLLKVKKPVQNGTLNITFELDVSGILKMSAVQAENGESVEAIFKSSRGIKIKQNASDEKIVVYNEATKNLINRAEELIKNKKLNDEDKSELTSLMEKYKNQKSEKDTSSSQTEQELLNLLYYLE